jgi:hypothetical protein
VSVAFGSPLGGVLFGLEELDTFATDPTGNTMWRGFVASAVAAVALQYVDPFGVGKLVLFQVSPTLIHSRFFLLIEFEGNKWRRCRHMERIRDFSLGALRSLWRKLTRIILVRTIYNFDSRESRGQC